jgi:hypothetical protein
VVELDELLRSDHLSIKSLNGEAKELFFELIADDLDGGLDDGEAAAVALAVSTRSSTAIVTDDRKARNLITRRWPTQRIEYSVDLLTPPNIEAGLTRALLADAVYSALKHARMRVPLASRAWTINLVGQERAMECPSLGSAV